MFSRHQELRESVRTFIRKLAARALLPKRVPEMLDWKSLCDLQGQDWRQLSNRDFLSRLKLKENLDAACLARVKKVYSEKQPTPEGIEAAVEATRDDFATKARGYLVHLLKVFLADISLNAGIVRGLSSFDPVALLNLPLEQATHFVSPLYIDLSVCEDGWRIPPRPMPEMSTLILWSTSVRQILGPRTPGRSSPT